MKIAISLPKEEFMLIEHLRHRLKVPRSKIIQQAIACWIENRRQKELVTKYETGYRKKPEKASHIIPLENLQYNALTEENW